MATTSAIPAVKAAVVALLIAEVGDSEVQIVWGRPQDSLVSAECVYVADARPRYEFANMKAGRKQYDERFDFDVLFCVSRAAGEVQEAAERCYALFASLRDILADDPSLGAVDGLVWARLGDAIEATAFGKGGAPVSIIEATVTCHARLT